MAARASGQMPTTLIPTAFVEVAIEGSTESVFVRARWLESQPPGPITITMRRPGPAVERWLTVTEAATELLEDDDGLDMLTSRKYISRAAEEGRFVCSGAGRDRRIDPLSFARWRCDRRRRRVEVDDMEDIELRKAAERARKMREQEGEDDDE